MKWWVALGSSALFLACVGIDPGQPSGGHETPEQLMAAAPPEWKPEGALTDSGGARFLAPAGWAIAQYTDGVGMRSPDGDGRGQCEIFVLAPRATPAGEAEQLQHLLQATQALFPPGTVLQDQYGGPDPFGDRWRGTSGRGFRYEGLFLSVSQSVNVLPFLADFGGTSVPVVIVEPRSSSTGCVNVLGDFGVAPAGVFHSLSLEGFTPSGAGALAANAVGKWSSSDGTAGSYFIFGANGRYLDSAVYSGVVEVSPGDWRSAQATWPGSGSYAVRGEVLGLFPSDDSARSRYVRQFQVRDVDGTWSDKLCWIARPSGGSAYTHCLWRTGQ